VYSAPFPLSFIVTAYLSSLRAGSIRLHYALPHAVGPEVQRARAKSTVISPMANPRIRMRERFLTLPRSSGERCRVITHC